MIPILYESDEINFISNGIGRLRDCIRCEVTEERNGIYECEFEYPVTGQHFDDIKCGRIIAVEHDEKGDVQPFDIISYTRPLNGVVTFHAQHISYRQKGITVIANSSSSGETTRSAFAKIKSGSPSNPFNYYSDMSGQHTMAAFDLTPRSARQLLGGIEGSILDAFGGEYEWDKFNVNLWKSRGTEKDYTIRYGVNLLDFQEELDTSEAYNACIPYWKGEDDLVLADPAMITAGESYSGRINCAPLDLTDKFEEKPTQQQVTDAGISYMSSNRPYLPSQTININFVRLQDSDEYDEYAALQKCSLCDSVKVVFPMYGVTGSFKIVKVVWDVLLERYIEMDLGNLYTTLSQALGIGGIQASADQANRNVAGAWGTAASAQSTASAAQESAASASQAASTAWEHADDAHQAATAAQASAGEAYTAANEAKASAVSANNSANNALVQLGIVEDVAGTLRWISEHGDYVLTTDTTVHSGTVYFVYEHGDYVPIASPDPGANPSANGWYILDVTQSTTDYIMAHLAVTSAGLWVLPVNGLAEHELVDSQGNQLVDSSNNPLVDFSTDPEHASGYKVLLSGTGMSIYNDEGAVVANYGETTTIGATTGGNVYIDSTSVNIREESTVLAKFDGNGVTLNDSNGNEMAKFYKNNGGTELSLKIGSYDTLTKLRARGLTADLFGDDTIGQQYAASVHTNGVYKTRYDHDGIYNNGTDYPTGTFRETSGSGSSSSSSSTWLTADQLEIEDGLWLVTFGCGFESDGNGDRRVILNTSSSSTSGTRNDIQVRAAAGCATQVHASRFVKVSATTTLYMHVYQNSGSTLAVYPTIRAIKLV